jgi:predicted RNase H-like HicB family nuclease
MSSSPAIGTHTTESAVRHYLSLPYRIAITRDGADAEDAWRAQVEELPGCEACGATPADAAERLPSAMADWVAGALSEGREIPEPRSARSYSGKLLLRMPLTLHAELAQAAEREQVSLNAYITGQLAAAIGWRRAPLPAPSDQAPPSRGQAFTWALRVNLFVVAFAALVALVLLVKALNGF